MTNRKELDYDELEQITGGVSGKYDRFNELKQTYNISIDKYETANHIGEIMLAWHSQNDGWYLGTILSSYEKTTMCNATERVCQIRVIETSFAGDPTGGTKTLRLDCCDCYIS